MSDLTDLEMTKLCADAVGVPVFLWTMRNHEHNGYTTPDRNGKTYNPLEDDAQAMALVKKLHLTLTPEDTGDGVWLWFAEWPDESGGCDGNMNRAIVECVAYKQSAAHDDGSKK